MKPGHPAVVVTQVAERQWHALDDDRVVGRGEASPRPDGRLFLSIDVWHSAVFDRLADVMLPALPRPLYTVVGETDVELTSQWRRAGFAIRRREWEYLVPTAPAGPSAVTIVPGREADENRLRELDRVIRAEVEAGIGWHEMPAEVLPRVPALDPSKYTIAARGDEYVGLLRLAAVPRQPRIGLVAVRASEQRRGIGRALLNHVLGSLHDAGAETASAEVSEANVAATALYDGIGARRTGSNLELVVR